MHVTVPYDIQVSSAKLQVSSQIANLVQTPRRSTVKDPRGGVPRNFNLPLSIERNLCPTPNLPPPLKLALLLSTLSTFSNLLPANLESIHLQINDLPILSFRQRRWFAQNNLGVLVLITCGYNILHNQVVDDERMLVVNRYFGGVRGRVGRLGEGTPAFFDGA